MRAQGALAKAFTVELEDETDDVLVALGLHQGADISPLFFFQTSEIFPE